MPNFTDQMGNVIRLDGPPKRVISLVPSQSELLWDLGLKQQLVGITKFCIHPTAMFKTVRRVGGTKQLDLDSIRSLKPDLIIGNMEENERSQISLLQREFNVWMSDVNTFNDAFLMIRNLGDIFGREEIAEDLVGRIETSLNGLRNMFDGRSLLYFIWNDPYMVAAEGTFINHVLQFLGFTNTASGLERYPVILPEKLRELTPDHLFLSTEPFPFNEKHISPLRSILPASKISIVDGELFSWYGSRLLKLAPYVNDLKKKMEFA